MKKILCLLICGLILLGMTGCKNKPIFADYLIEKSNDVRITNIKDGNSKEMFTFKHEKTDQTEKLTDYRYIGSDPNNYVSFNDELWRIIGVFPIEGDKYVKLIRDTSLGKFSWDFDINGNSSSNWKKSSLHHILSSYSLGDSKYSYTAEVSYYTKRGTLIQSGYEIKEDNFDNPLDEKFQNYIEYVSYYLGGRESETSILSGEEMYNIERSKSDNKYIDSQTVESFSLMYASDVIYTFKGVDDDCYNHIGSCDNYSLSWLSSGEEWFLNTLGNSVIYASSTPSSVKYSTIGADKLTITKDKYVLLEVRPVVHLRKDIKVVEGDGTKDNPYILAK